MAGLRRIAKMYGGLVAKDSKKVVVHKWDYKKDEPYVESVTERKDKPERTGVLKP